MATSSPNKFEIEGTSYSKWLSIFVFGVLLIAAIQTAFKPLSSASLTGEEWVPIVDPWSPELMTDNSWQDQVDHHVTKKFGFRAAIIRFYNQVLYSTIGEKTPFIAELGDGYLLEKVYRSAMCGDNYIGREKMAARADSLIQLNELMRKNNQHLTLLIAPNKWRYYADRIGESCEASVTNYDALLNELKEDSVHVFDCVQWFDTLSADFSIGSRSGTHWSVYGAALVAQELQRQFIERGVATNPIEIESVEETETPRFTDKDLHDLLNIMQPPPKEDLAYPVLQFPGDKKPRVLVVGDSYYLTFYYLGVHANAYSEESKLLYYNKKLTLQDRNVGRPFTQEEFQTELRAADIVLVMANEDALAKLGWGFLSDAIDVLNE